METQTDFISTQSHVRTLSEPPRKRREASHSWPEGAPYVWRSLIRMRPHLLASLDALRWQGVEYLKKLHIFQTPDTYSKNIK